MAKGRQAERDVCELLDQVGYEYYHPPKAKFREQDVFGLYDILAFGYGHILAVQVKGSSTASGITSWFQSARVFERRLQNWTVLFIHCTEGTIRVAGLSQDGYRWLLDGREHDRPDHRLLEEVLLT
jgi:hypothetical protein